MAVKLVGLDDEGAPIFESLKKTTKLYIMVKQDFIDYLNFYVGCGS